MPRGSRPRPRRFLIVGGGCFGTHYTRAILRAIDRGRMPKAEIWIVDRDPGCTAAALEPRAEVRLVISDWDGFFEEYLDGWHEGGAGREEDLLVPVHTSPHLFARWLERVLGRDLDVAPAEVPFLPETPVAQPAADGGFAISFADWLCPAHCIEPFLCPATRQQRSWDISRALVAYARRLRAAGLGALEGPLLARCTHLVEGVGVISLSDWCRAARRITARPGQRAGHALIGTVSGCHGIAQLFAVQARTTKD
jgi:hypothetical protein